jgi:hypothetical protein
MGPEHSLPWSKQPIIHSYPHPDKTSPHSPILVPLILSSHPCIGLASSHFPLHIPTKTLNEILFSPTYTSSHHPEVSTQTTNFPPCLSVPMLTQYSAHVTNHEVPHYSVFSNPKLLQPPSIQTFSCIPFLTNLGLHFFSLYENKFPTHKLLEKQTERQKML